ncbi:hypothetical protein BUZ11_13715 [Staphylococcus gallinarum]|uniref:Uncharacterized protein n=1 Tax=Staphylococcus gallinarum TaxID=1293 RepID=A0A2T4SVI4_STAGA|nr:hypothetical protein BUZ00_13230 [Staphylococcus gallinarum]PTL08882.1 hypothetical protein BUZ15_11230 [Staphylococcus gallinarum]PTL09957.1 hypothetical protein BUZ09_04770 [Staphylococcus gallinarum]RIL21041.1 hypothetical protein BUY97_12740 [Staphylococcus gallinarum]RIL27455.1 hypothetical protein BUY95_10635 [Staphylococcus gallinarum]
MTKNSPCKEITIVIQFIKKGMIALKWFLSIVQIILGVFLAFFAYKQMNQNHLDTWFIIFTVFSLIFVLWFAKHYDKS